MTDGAQVLYISSKADTCRYKSSHLWGENGAGRWLSGALTTSVISRRLGGSRCGDTIQHHAPKIGLHLDKKGAQTLLSG